MINLIDFDMIFLDVSTRRDNLLNCIHFYSVQNFIFDYYIVDWNISCFIEKEVTQLLTDIEYERTSFCLLCLFKIILLEFNRFKITLLFLLRCSFMRFRHFIQSAKLIFFWLFDCVSFNG